MSETTVADVTTFKLGMEVTAQASDAMLAAKRRLLDAGWGTGRTRQSKPC